MIDLSKPRYDQSTYWGRLRHFSEITSPTTLFTTDAELERAKQILRDYKAGILQLSDEEEEKLWRAKRLVDSTIHPDTGEKVVLPFRMAAFVPTNVLIVAGMLLPNPSIASIIFWQWVNQSVNVAFNYFNANKSTEMNVTETATAYCMAVASSCTIAVGMNEWVKRVKHVTPLMKTVLQRAVPFTAVAAAGTLNVFLMRQKELVDGIDIQDEHGNNLGKSTAAGAKAITQVAVSRVATSFPVVFIPGMIMSQLERTRWLRANPRLVMPVNLLTITGSLMAALPCAIALFPQTASMPVSQLEPKFHDLRDANGNPIKTVYFNRGL
ncbi:Tricarboxylate/iron carrier [Polychytrium aggregatum]|uniref:Tricarboxylate/iron carrier n=1 Tax=Polychytrium aggregatum TaxID=110093 RepID=UPI0022FE29C9|nr:Tricarboxylate/iron carrier [Polychytrium aggregatum]KAI9203505.1 Tricarboxylate/iron carrier [Polychytrium aggregatum]